METTTFEISVNGIRKQIKDVAKILNELKDFQKERPENDNENRGEVLANLTLCYRHLEDASTRLGKALQACDGGVSVYDKDTTVGL